MRTLDFGLDTGPLETMPLWAMVVVLVALLMLGHEAGFQLRRWMARRQGAGHPEDVVAGYLPAALGLLALLVGFTFGMSLDRYNTRRNLVMDEANAIESHYRRLETIEEPTRTRLSQGLLHYLDTRLAFSKAQGPAAQEQAAAVSDAAERRLWSETVNAVAASKSPQAGGLLNTANDMFKWADTRRWALQARVPLTIVRALLIYALIASVFMGYGLPLGRRFFVPSTVQFVLLAVAFSLVMDLDRPHAGIIRVSQAPLEKTAAEIRRIEAERGAPPLPARDAQGQR